MQNQKEKSSFFRAQISKGLKIIEGQGKKKKKKKKEMGSCQGVVP